MVNKKDGERGFRVVSLVKLGGLELVRREATRREVNGS